MKNVYDGVVDLDADGAAWVDLPDWFEALNGDYRYQLTPIGAPGPNLFIASEIASGSFRIAGGRAGMRVSWQVTGVRKDASAEARRIVVEQDKPELERGLYLDPEAFGLPREAGADHVLHDAPQAARRQRVEQLAEETARLTPGSEAGARADTRRRR